MKSALVIGAISLSLGLVKPLSATTIVFQDSDFPVIDWSEVELIDSGNNGSLLVNQVLSGGNPDTYRQGFHDWGPGLINYAHLYTPQTYNPSVSGTISSLDFSYDFSVLEVTNPSNGAVATEFLLEQDNVFYTNSFISQQVNPGIWTTNFGFGLVSDDFVDVAGSTQKPDFSINGGEIAFGFATLNLTGIASGRTSTWGVDNWKVTINQPNQSVPEPSSLISCLLVLSLSVGINRNRNK
ncbi:MAG: hypothetical protein F6J86_35475 [Symploca sp. SIO1B1]|nr:hypothetical protein [Symploca sp. SIO1B1]